MSDHVTYSCSSCGGSLTFAPGQDSLVCPFCNAKQDIANLTKPVYQEEIDFESARKTFFESATEEVRLVTCSSCGGESTLDANIEAAHCHFCNTPLVVTGKSQKAMKPQYILPFKIDKKTADVSFRSWMKKRWFAPNNLKTLASVQEPLKGIYYPYWTFDSQSETSYVGQRGEHYTVQVQSKDANGNTVTRSEVHTRWYPVSGHVSKFFDDVLIPASANLPLSLADRFSTWNLGELVEANPAVLAGFLSETYSVGIDPGFESAKEKMNAVITSMVRSQIGGDEQRIISQNTSFNAVTFKYVQLPIWTMAYRYNAKFYKVLVNGQTGEVVGKRPYSAIKILLAVLLGIGVAVGAYFLINYLQK